LAPLAPAWLEDLLTVGERTTVAAIRRHAADLLDHTPRFPYFTLHGSAHIANLFGIVQLLCNAGLKLADPEAYLLACSICIHDLGMVVSLQDKDLVAILQGKPQPADPANLEIEIRAIHHELVSSYVAKHFDFLTGLGLTPSDCAILRDISRNHRKTDLDDSKGHARTVGALLRAVDELDISPSRAPAQILREHFRDMDATSCWHWFKHNICEDWQIGHNVICGSGNPARVVLKVAVHPPRDTSIPYWLTQTRRPIAKVFYDEGTTRILAETWGMSLSLEASQELSSSISLGDAWDEIEQKCLSAGRKVILVVDDEARKLEDLFLPLMNSFHVIFSQNARDALDKLAAAPVDLAVVDLQIGSGRLWTDKETTDFKMTGVKLCEEIHRRFPNTQVGILTGSHHDLEPATGLPDLRFLLRKPIPPEQFEKEVYAVLS
jgi:hypothetical protein